MSQIVDFFKGLFSSDLWPPRWYCGKWSDFHGWLYIISDLTIWLAYFMIPIIILDYFIKRKSQLKFEKVYFLFAAFILLCGITHFVDAVMFWVPMYRLNALTRFVTAIVSILTVLYLIKILPQLFKQKTNLELEREIAKRKEAELKLAEANKGLQAFAYVASHDLQEPLRKVRMFASRLSENEELLVNDNIRNYTQKILSSSEKMQVLIEDILRLSSISSEIEMNDVAMNKVLENVMDDQELKINDKNAEINYKNLHSVKGDEAYLNQLFSNLLSNSLKFTHRRPLINIYSEKEGNKVKIYFSDNGIGMKQEDAETIFETFKQLNPKSEFEGSGIGLSICKKIVDVHKGKLSVTSTPGEGTTFIIELMAADLN